MFAATGTARPRLLRVAGRMAAGLTLLWLAALALGVGGLGSLPAIDLPVVGKPGGGSHHSSAPGAKPAPLAAARSDSARAAEIGSAHARRAARARRLAQPGATSRPSNGKSPQTGSNATANAQPGSATTASPHYSDSAVRRGTSSTAPGSRRSTTDTTTTTTTDSTASPRGNAVGRNTDPGVRRKSPR